MRCQQQSFFFRQHSNSWRLNEWEDPLLPFGVRQAGGPSLPPNGIPADPSRAAVFGQSAGGPPAMQSAAADGYHIRAAVVLHPAGGSPAGVGVGLPPPPPMDTLMPEGCQGPWAYVGELPGVPGTGRPVG